ncbi:cytochrome b6 [Striga asiatica]|uniref:Cytochrome b6 n=1 Tax=Striga asiatica TaxID=4170 RepID=A0A5A7QHS7_STRAF|nr:cytochrome b6 [Striga asiatica]
MEEPEPLPQITPIGRSIGVSNSPEFEFFSSFSPTDLLTADQLFSGGVLLPLHHLRLSDNTPPPAPDPESSGSDPSRPDPEPEVPSIGSARLTAVAPSTQSLSRRWSDIFRRNEKKSPRTSMDMDVEDLINTKEKDTIVNGFKEKKRERSTGGRGSGVTAAELNININIWPFSRSRSAGNGAGRPRPAAARKASSAPCSRSNSASESKSRRWPSSPGRGVPVGRSSPVWQARRGGGRRSFESAVRKDGGEGRRKVPPPVPGGHSRARSLSLNIPTCIGYRQHSGCRSAECVSAAASAGGGGGEGVAAEGVRGSGLFSIKSLFTRKVN